MSFKSDCRLVRSEAVTCELERRLGIEILSHGWRVIGKPVGAHSDALDDLQWILVLEQGSESRPEPSIIGRAVAFGSLDYLPSESGRRRYEIT